jgi:hypothetical protein
MGEDAIAGNCSGLRYVYVSTSKPYDVSAVAPQG